MAALDAVARLRCRVVSEPLGAGPEVSTVLRAAAGSDGLVCLTGLWAGGGALLTSDPLLVLPPDADPVAALDVQPVLDHADPDDADPDVVGGGWFGVLAYDGPSRLAFHDHLLRYRDGVWFFEALWSAERDALLQARRDEAQVLIAGAGPAPWRVGAFGGADRAAHLAAVERAVELIRAGEIYQVNVCTRLAAPFTGSAVGLFADAIGTLHPAYGAFLDAGDRALAGFSPELFLRRRGREVRTSPIKGTAPRTDSAGADVLRRSAKDAAENVMIVDLMRNDLGRVCEVGSVRAESLLGIEAHPGVWHLVSTVTGRLADGVGDADLLRATFPPGSVTGAPKTRAEAVIASLETTPRVAYTGAIGFASPSWGAEFGVVIRSFEIVGDRIELGVGGGVTADSVSMLEWRECLDKAAPLLGALGTSLSGEVATPECLPSAAQVSGGVFETLLAVDGRVLRAADHLARLDRSCRELFGTALPGATADEVRDSAAGTTGRLAVRVVVAADGSVVVTATPVGERPGPADAHTIYGRGGLWRHKWADRGYLAAQEISGVPLFVAEDGAVLETSRGNLFLLGTDGTLVTPPLRDDLLPGVTRRALLDLARDCGRPTELRAFGPAELRASAAFWTSSLSLAVPIASVDGVSLPRRDAEIEAIARILC